MGVILVRLRKEILRRVARCGLFLFAAFFCGSSFPLHATPSYELVGHGTTGVGGWDLLLNANLNSTGSDGFAHLVGGATGPIVAIIPPTNDPNNLWCINVRRTDTSVADGDQRWNIYIRDVGDGITTFDQFSFVTGIGIDCSFPTRDLFFIPVTEGNFTANVTAPGVPDENSTIVVFLIALGSIDGCRRFLPARKLV